MKKGKIKALLVLLVIVLAGIYYYVTIPAINIHSTGIWIFILFVLVLILAAYAAKKKFTSIREVKSSKFLKIGGIVLMAVLLVFAAGSILSSPHRKRKTVSKSADHRGTRLFGRYPAGEFQSDSVA